MNIRLFKPIIFLAMLIFLVSVACQALSSTPAPQAPATVAPVATEAPAVEAVATEAPAATDAPAATEAPQDLEAAGKVTSLQDVKNAVIQIVAQGTFVDPEEGLYVNATGSGSGFIIDPSGIAVTNNHVVTGAGLLKVYVNGESTPRNARVLGVSECSDLAVIDIDGDNFSYLDWYGGPIDVGTDIYVAGFPLGDPEYSLTKGIISKAKADGETSWSSVDSVIEYDATTNPGNSGGPVVSDNGEVIGVHYASLSSARQAFGISRDVAQSIIERLRNGENVDTVGINGQAVTLNEDGSLTGIWVSSVQSGSPADQAGIQPGDILLSMESLDLATDGTMSQYCDILRSHTPGDTLSVEVLRLSTAEVLDGQLNGRELEVAYTLDDLNSGGTDTNGEGSTSGDGPVVNTDASASGDIYYSTKFDEGVTDWEYFLGSGEDANFTQEANNGVFRTEINDDDTYVYYLLKGWEFSNVRIDTRVESLGANKNFVGLVCRLSDDGWYEANINNNGEYSIWLFDANASGNRYKLLFSGGSTLINMGKDVNEYTLICNEDELTLGINGTEVRTVSLKSSANPLLRSGQAGLSVSSIDITPVIVEFDDFILSVP